MPSKAELADDRLPDLADIEAAKLALAPLVVETPLIVSEQLDERAGGRIFIKPELLQRTGSFKFRGAYTKISRLAETERARGVVAFSSGNHAQGVAAAARLLGVHATIVMPADAPAIKVENTRRLGAEVVFYDRNREDREAIAQALAERKAATLVPPYDDPDIIAGQGTIGLELVRQAQGRGVTLDLVLTPCSGGGLMAGCATAVKALSPKTELATVEPAGFDDMARSLASGCREQNAPGGRSICDALLVQTPGLLTFAINRRLVSHGVAVTDAEVKRAIAFAFRVLKLVVEPSGAVPLAAVLEGRVPATGKTIAIVLSGGNVDAATYSAALAAE